MQAKLDQLENRMTKSIRAAVGATVGQRRPDIAFSGSSAGNPFKPQPRLANQPAGIQEIISPYNNAEALDQAEKRHPELVPSMQLQIKPQQQPSAAPRYTPPGTAA
jgi:hypothetical protein